MLLPKVHLSLILVHSTILSEIPTSSAHNNHTNTQVRTKTFINFTRKLKMEWNYTTTIFMYTPQKMGITFSVQNRFLFDICTFQAKFWPHFLCRPQSQISYHDASSNYTIIVICFWTGVYVNTRLGPAHARIF